MLEAVGHTNVKTTVDFYPSDNSEKLSKKSCGCNKNEGEEEKGKQKK